MADPAAAADGLHAVEQVVSYASQAHADVRPVTLSSVGKVVPMILAHLGIPDDRTVEAIDVGCGEGWWAQGLQAHGARVTALDYGTPEVLARGVTVVEVDLEDDYTLPRNGYDLALCLEVAEHLTEDAGRQLVAELCASSRVVAWSAAIPGQVGHGHITLRWPTYWAEVFREHGYVLLDPWRRALWDDPEVASWYAQNLLLAQRATGPTLAEVPAPACLIHPDIYLGVLSQLAGARSVAESWQVAAEARAELLSRIDPTWDVPA